MKMIGLALHAAASAAIADTRRRRRRVVDLGGEHVAAEATERGHGRVALGRAEHVTELLAALRRGDHSARRVEQLFPAVELHLVRAAHVEAFQRVEMLGEPELPPGVDDVPPVPFAPGPPTALPWCSLLAAHAPIHASMASAMLHRSALRTLQSSDMHTSVRGHAATTSCARDPTDVRRCANTAALITKSE